MIRAEIEYELAKEHPFGVAELVALDVCPVDLLIHFASFKYWESVHKDGYSNRLNIALAAQEHPRLPIPVITKSLLESPDTGSVIYLWCVKMLSNPNVPTQVFAEMLERRTKLGSRDEFVSMIISHPNCPIEAIEEESIHESWVKRSYVATRSMLSREMVERMLYDKEENIQRLILVNMNIDPLNFEILLRESPDHIKKMSPSILQLLVPRMPEGEKRQRAVEMLTLRSKGRSSREVICRYSNDSEVVMAGCMDATIQVRRQAILNPVAPLEGLIAATLLNMAPKRRR
jgi:hypothetical protein